MDETPADMAGADPAARARHLHGALMTLRARIEASTAHSMARWSTEIERDDFAASASNLADYLALRRTELGTTQAELAALGLSSLGRAEGHVRATLDAVLASLSIIGGAAQAAFPDPAAFDAGQRLLNARRDALFGAGTGARLTRIMATLPSRAATDGGALIASLVAKGADCLRINTAHDDAQAWAQMIGHIHAAADAAGRKVPVLMDLGGPKLRIEALSDAKKHLLHEGDRFALALEMPKKPALLTATLTDPVLLAHLTPGAAVWIDDGKLRAMVVEAREDGAVLEVTGARSKGARLKLEKGVNLPGADLSIPALTAEDRAHLEFVVEHADMVGFSFVQTPQDVQSLIAAMREIAGDRLLPSIVLKIETPLAVRNLPELIVTAGGALPVAVMIARGDLAVEIGFERLSEIQEEILWLCEAAQVPVVWATQVLEGLLKEGQASRAETTDAAMGQRAECVMLNKGPYLPQAVGFLSGILARMDRHQHKKTARLGALHVWGDL